MDKSKLKITELPLLSVASENGFIPIAQVNEENETFKLTMKGVRETVLFENAFTSVDAALAVTVKDDTFFVYTDESKEYVTGWLNSGSGAIALLDSNSEQLTYGTYALLRKALKDKGAVVQWVYKGGIADGGEQTFTVPLTGKISVQEVYVDGLRQFKDVGFEVSDDDGMTFTLAAPVKKGQTVVALCSGKDDLDKLNQSLVALYSSPVGASNIGVQGGGTVESSLKSKLDQPGLAAIMGFWVGATTEIKSLVSVPQKIFTRGFYAEGDGGDGLWLLTGKQDTSRSGTHVINEGKIYNANGDEYILSLTENEADLRINGAKEVAGKNALISDDFVCAGQVFNGIMNVFGYVYDDGSSSIVKYGNSFSTLTVHIRAGTYRVGKETPQIRSSVSVNLHKTNWMVYPHSDFTYGKTGKLLHGFSTKDNAAYWRNQTTSWDLASWNYGFIKGGTLIGDQVPGKSRTDCTAGIGLEIINPQHVIVENVTVHNFLADCVAREWNSVIPTSINIIDSAATYVTTKDDAITRQQGHFYGINFINCNFLGSRDVTLVNLCDWVSWRGGNLFNQYNWVNGVEGKKPKYILIQAGSSWSLDGGQLGVYHDDTGSSSPTYPYTYAPELGVVYECCKQVSYQTFYSEWVKSLITVGGDWGSTPLSTLQRYWGLRLDHDTQYKPNQYSSIVKFAPNFFGKFTGDDYNEWTWTDGQTYSRGDVPRALASFALGTPVRDEGAFEHGGYDFQYGTYNVGFTGSVTPDIDSLRGNREAKEFISDAGLMVNSGQLMLPLKTLALDSNVVIWYKDLTGNFNPQNAIINEYSYVSGGGMLNQYVAKGNLIFDYGNGYKAMVIRNLRPFGYSEERGWSPQNYLKITVTSDTPIVLKSVQAFQGGIPLFPGKLRTYSPASQGDRIWGTQTSLTAMDLYPNNLGGGIFNPGDVLDTWNYVAHKNRWDYTQNTNDYGYPKPKQVVSARGGMGALFNSAFSVTIAATDAKTTTVTIPSANLVYVTQGIPLNVTATTGTGTVKQYNIVKRISNANGTLTNQYVLDGVAGAVGDTLTVNNGTAQTVIFQPSEVYGLKTTQWANIGTTLTVTSNSYLSNTFLTGTLRATETAKYDLGSSSFTWNNIYSQNAVTVVSDRRLKDEIAPIDDAVLDAWGSVNFSQWKLKTAIAEKGKDEARVHFGIVAQDIKEAFENAGLDATHYGILIYDSWETSAEVLDEEGNVIEPAKEAGDIWMVRMEECLALEAAYCRREMALQKAQLQSLMDALGHS